MVTSGPEHFDKPGPYREHVRRRTRRRKNINLIASRHRVDPLPGPDLADPAEGYPERHLVVRVDVDSTAIDVHNVHVPPGTRVKMLKVAFFEAMIRRVDAPTSAARILLGDFNSPRSESDDGFVLGARRDPDEDRRWKEAELAFLDHSEMRDAISPNARPGNRSQSPTSGATADPTPAGTTASMFRLSSTASGATAST